MQDLAIRDLAIVVPFYNGHDTIERLLASLPRQTPVFVVDDCSDNGRTLDETRLAQLHPQVRVMRLPRKRYFAGAVNAGIAASQGDVLVLNQDVHFTGDRWQKQLAVDDSYALVGERIAGEHPAFPGHGYIHGTFMLMRRAAIERVGLLAERDFPLWGATAEWQWRAARAGYKILPLPEVLDFHHERGPARRFGSGIRRLLDVEPMGRHDLLIRTPPLISVIVACHNYGRYLSDCLASLIGGRSSLGHQSGQTMQGFEVVIVDDASTDETPQVAANLADSWKGIFYHRTPRRLGTAGAYNYGIAHSHGKYITILSADDMRRSDALERLYAAQEANPHSFVYDDIVIFGDGKLTRWWRMDDFDFERLLFKNHIHAGIMFPRAAWVAVGGYPEVMDDGREDWAMNIALAQAGYCGVHVESFGYLYRREGQNRSLTNTTPLHRTYFLEKIMGLFPSLYAPEIHTRGGNAMACCGGKKAANTGTGQASAGAAQTMLASAALGAPGSSGMTQLVYTGRQVGVSTYTGQATGLSYRFGANRPVAWVDNRDVGERGTGGLLNLKQNGQYVFARAGAPSTITTDFEGGVEHAVNPDPDPDPAPEPAAQAAPSARRTRRKKDARADD